MPKIYFTEGGLRSYEQMMQQPARYENLFERDENENGSNNSAHTDKGGRSDDIRTTAKPSRA